MRFPAIAAINPLISYELRRISFFSGELLLLDFISAAVRRLCSLPAVPPKLKNLNYRHRSRALAEAQRALTEYLHATRSLPFSHADQIAANSPFAIATLVSQIPFPPNCRAALIPHLLRRFLAYSPVNEFHFFFESIGLDPPFAPKSPLGFLFLADDPSLLAGIAALVRFGFPWTKLGLLYREDSSVFRRSDLVERLHGFESLGFRRVCVIGICLAFPSVLGEPGGEVDSLFRDLKWVLADFDMGECSEEGDDVVEAFLRICRRIRVFYNLGSKKGEMGELMGRNRRIFLELEEAVLAQKLNFFSRLGMEKDEVGPFVLRNPEILDFDLENTGIAMPDYLKSIGFDDEDVGFVSRRYPHVMGKNRLGNLPGLMRALRLNDWFLSKLLDGNIHFLSPAYASVTLHGGKTEDEFLNDMKRVKSGKKVGIVHRKVEFLLSIGLGENKITTKAAGLINSTSKQLQERFDCLLGIGVDYPMLCRIISASPRLLNQSTDKIHEKVNYLCNDLGYSLDYLDNFPAFLCFDLENRIKPRYRFLNWLKNRGLSTKRFSPATVLANSEKRFVISLLSIHPAAPKIWLEMFSSRSDSNGNQRVLFLPHPGGSKS